MAFLADALSSQTEGKQIHVICDNVSSHKTPAVPAFLVEHTDVAMHYPPTYSSEVENWFLDKKLMRYIRQYNKDPKPLKWKYDNPCRHIQCNSTGSVH